MKMVIIIITIIIIKINYKENVVLNRNPTKKTKVAFIICLYLMEKGGTVEYVIRSAKVIRENGHSR